ncbi:unnamed protein product [Auanema sp. JU1783]|nr:unnamed protein product [Auanema sp. JU1783]
MRLLLVLGFVSLALAQNEDDSALHFSNEQNGRAVWIIDDTNLPWAGSYDYISTVKAMPETVLMTIVDSSTGNILGECKTDEHGKWTRFQWVLEANSLHCIVSATNASRVEFPPSQAPRTFSVRIQAAIGPSCVRDLVVQNERPSGCPPRLSNNSFSSLHLQCGCPLENSSAEDAEPSGPQFPIFDLNLSPTTSEATTEFSLGPCADYNCQNNGTCVVTQDGLPTCLCPSGFIGSSCEVDLCRDVPCQFGGVCRTNGAEAFCECRPGFTGVLCETPVCETKCSNGQCVVDEGVPKCECRQGFMGINCNVIDVCLGDAACAMFGDNAKCVVDPTSYKINTPTLINATYDCRCPHPANGEFVDCLQLHLATISGSAMVEPTSSPSFPAVEMQSLPGFLPTQTTTKKRVLVEDSTALPTLVPEIEPNPTFSIHPSFPASSFVPDFSPTSHIVSTTPSMVPTIANTVHVAPSTFIFPNFPESTPQPVIDHKPTHPLFPTGPAPQPTFETIKPDIGFPTPAPMPQEEELEEENESVPPVEQSTEVNSFNAHVTPVPEVHPETMSTNTPIPDTTTEEEDTTVAEYEEEIESSEGTTAESFTTMELTTEFLTETPTTEATTTTEEPEPETTTMVTIPLWLLTTQTTKPPVPFVPHVVTEFVPRPTEMVHTGVSEVSEENNVSNENISNETHELENVTRNPTSPDVHQQEGGSERQKSSAASWIVAIVALIVLGLLLLAASLFVLRYIKQSRKLHGKYNPAREEHALSAAYSMPMSHMTKEERLI